MLAYAFPDRVARNRGNGSFVLANGRGAAVEQTCVARARALYRGRRNDGDGGERPHPACRANHRGRDRAAFRRAYRDVDEISFDRGAIALRARRKRGLHAITLSEAHVAVSPS